jgi:4-aminobutyrate aminotransferase-like enzyme
MRLSYDRPVHAVSADGVWITEADGSKLLDAYNNVAHVGHGRPEVVEAIAAQAARLNTNTRYLVSDVIEYAERLGNLFPGDLNVVYFANSGSEANDLAWRMARTVTGRTGAIVSSHAYHGSTDLTMATSPEELGIDRLPPWVATIQMPAGLRAPSLEAAVFELSRSGHAPAFLAFDTVLSSDGIFDPSPALPSFADQIRAAGGLMIADEVQAGFGRIGPSLWGYAAAGITPDIVTLGKPMGNGHPIAAVVTTPSIAQRFTDRGYYFSTFAGNPVSAAAGMAMLDVLEAEALPDQAQTVGTSLRSALRSIDHPLIKDVRGRGAFTGVEIGQSVPDQRTAQTIVDGMRDRHVLIGRTGVDHNVLKIRPPLVFGPQHVGVFLDAFADTLASL